jgi:hypothetical protein
MTPNWHENVQLALETWDKQSLPLIVSNRREVAFGFMALFSVPASANVMYHASHYAL